MEALLLTESISVPLKTDADVTSFSFILNSGNSNTAKLMKTICSLITLDYFLFLEPVV
jgi:hypothetical protein